MLKKLFSQSVIYGASTILSRLINYVLVPLHTQVLSTDSYGVVSILYAWLALLNVFYTYGMETTYFRFESKDDQTNSVFKQILSTILVTSLFFSGLIFLNVDHINHLFSFGENAFYLKWFALLLAIDAISVVPFAKLRTQGKAIKFVSIKLMMVILTVILNWVFFYGFPRWVENDIFLLTACAQIFYDPDIGYGYAFIANVCANGLGLLFLARELMTWRWSWNWKVWLTYMAYGLPLVGAGLAANINEVADRQLLNYLLPKGFYDGITGLDAVGIYSACYKLSIFISIAVQGFKYAAEPFFFQTAKDKNAPVLLSKVMTFFVLFCITVGVGIVTNLGWLKFFIRDEAYHVGIPVVPILILANIFLGVYYNLSVWFKVSDKTYWGAIIGWSGAMITIVFNFLLIPKIGYFGSAIATLFCYGAMSGISYLLGRKYSAIPYETGKIGLFIIAYSVICFISYKIGWEFNTQSILFQNTLLVVFLLFILFMERKFFLSIVNKFLRK